ncbi:amino acid ABC transporter permease [Knoellia koreensis]|uniref:Amino acid ABC transporter permease n=1 Tax=Knoellia koreensis TaxID=2730921 RepID=A0A849H7R7_9MICO|nr:amino acid ABC transporter permease [Knoellia sp. DB2414S]NNM45786.1 amino acid ABC transporter permease [Knoellia sp. DB2414S]
MTDTTDERPGPINARPVPHPWRWVALVVIAILVAMMISSFVTNDKWDFPFALRVMNYNPVLDGLVKGTILGTVGAMVLGVGLGIIVGIMRLSTNPVLRGVSFVYTWFFRAIPRYVLLTILGTGLGYLYSTFDIGVPFGKQIAGLLGLSNDLTFFSLDVNQFSSTLAMGIIGLGLSEAAYMAEIARAGILSVDKGQTEAAHALGMSSGKTMRRVVLPQAMRVIVPPTGNETIAMVKDTSLLLALPVTTELFFQTQAIGTRTLQIMPTMVAATLWYLIVCSVLMVGQNYLEKRFGRGFGTGPARGDTSMLAKLRFRAGAGGA